MQIHYLMGEKHVLDTIFKSQAHRSKGLDAAYSKLRPKLIGQIESELDDIVNGEVCFLNIFFVFGVRFFPNAF